MDYTALSDHNLMEAAGRGEKGAFETLVERHKNWVVNLLYHNLHDFQAAEDLAQETFLRVFRKLHTYTTKAQFTTWLYIIASNLARTEIRRRKTHIVKKESELQARGETDSGGAFANMPTNYMNPNDPERMSVWECLSRMDEDDKNILILRDIQDFDYEELAKILNCPLGTIKSRMSRARMKFKEIYERITRTNI